MPQRDISFPWFGVLLIIVGSVLLLDRLSILSFGFARIIWTTVSLIGAFHVVNGFSRKKNGAIFWGTVVFLYGLYFFLRTLQFLEFYPHLLFSASLLIFGIAFLVLYVNNVKEWGFVIPGVLLGGLGTVLLLDRVELYELKELWLSVRRYWPVVLILTGIAILIGGKLKRPTA
jgi:hypothetical protein